MGRSDEAFYVRLKALACRFWGLPPWEFDAVADTDQIAAEDMLELMLLQCHEPMGANPLKFLMRETEARKDSKVAEMGALVLQLKATKDPKKKARLRQAIKEANKWR